jgi:hypothetical protein
MSRAGDKSRIAKALREDAAGAVRPDLDLWPMIRERIAARGASAASQASAIADPSTGTATRPARSVPRKPTLHLSLAGALPVLVLVVAMVGAYFAPAGMLSWLNGGTRHDPCGLITQQEADAFVGTHLEQVKWEPARPGALTCAYNGQDESLNLLVVHLDDQEQAEAYLVKRLSGLRASNAMVMLPEEDRARTYADKVPGLADEAYEATVESQGGTSRYFHHIMARQGSTYVVVTWMTSQPDTSSELTTLAHYISGRLRSW